MDSLFKKIEVLRAIAHPVRIRILEELTKGMKCVSDFESFSGINQPNFSQHLSVLRKHGVVDCYIDGRLRCYFLVNPMLPELIEALKKERTTLPAPASCQVHRKGKYTGKSNKK